MRTLLLFAAAIASLPAQAQDYPVKAIRAIVPYSAGSGMDILGRPLARKLNEAFGQPVIADNRVGGAGRVGHDVLVKSPPDGYTILLTALGPLIQTPLLYPQTTQYDPLKDFAPISLFATGPLVVVVHPSLPAKNLKELIAFAKARRDPLNYGSTGVGSVNHMLGEMINQAAGIRMAHVPYKGGSDALTELLGGHLEIVMTSVAPAIPHTRSGRLRIIATTGRTRMPALPEVHTMAESGLPSAEIVIWWGAVAPAGTPRPIVNRLNAEIVKAVASPEVRDRYLQDSVVPTSSTIDEFARIIRDDHARWSKVIASMKLKLE